MKLLGRFLLLFVAAFPLMGAKCGGVQKPYANGSSRNVQVKPGTGAQDWYYGSFPYTPLSFAGDLFDQININRAYQGIPRMKWHDGMALNAQKHSIDMNTRGYLSLVTPEGVDLAERLVSSKPRIDFDELYNFVTFTQTPTQVYDRLISSPDANAAMFDPSVTHFGASFQANPGPYYVTILFAVNATP